MSKEPKEKDADGKDSAEDAETEKAVERFRKKHKETLDRLAKL